MHRASEEPLREKCKIVSIQFLTPDEDAIEVRAEVREREAEMVISIPAQHSSGPYLVRGKKVEHFFAGIDSLEHEEPVDVVARWTRLGDIYVGIWIENRVEYLFSFRAPRSPSSRGQDR